MKTQITSLKRGNGMEVGSSYNERMAIAEKVMAENPNGMNHHGLIMEERIRIGQRIAELRKAAGLTQVQLGEKCGILGNHITRIEKGRYSVGLDTLTAIAKALNKRIDFV